MTDIMPTLHSCGTPQHKVVEAFRWMRALLAERKAKPEEIGIAAASPADFDDHVFALSQDANWLARIMERRPIRVAAVALANKIARMAWAVMARGERFKEPRLLPVAAAETSAEIEG